MKITIDRNDILDLQITLKKEYLLSNNKGGYCSSTVLDCHTRKYHGLLVLPLEGSNEVINYLSKLEVKAIINQNEFHLSTNKYPGVYYPTGHKYIEKFEYEIIPETYYIIGDVKLKKSIMMLAGEDTVMVRYDLLQSPKPVKFKAEPLLAFRSIHSLSHQNIDIQPRTYFEKNGFKITPYQGLPSLYLQTSIKSVFYPAPDWWYNFEYLKERNRGYDYQEDLFCPGVFEFSLSEGKSIIFRASLQPHNGMYSRIWDKHYKLWKSTVPDRDPEHLKTLKFQGKKLIFKDKTHQTGLLAGYHWYREWTRDALVSFEGLMLEQNMYEEAGQMLKKYASLMKNNRLPKIVQPDGNHIYDALDPTLLFLTAVQKFHKRTDFAQQIKKELLPALKQIVSSILLHKNDDAYIGNDGLLYAGTPGQRHTWMDAEVDGKPVTPRHGAAIELNAWWYNGLKYLVDYWSSELEPDLLSAIKHSIQMFEQNFENKFWNEKNACFCDVYRSDDDRDESIRPNQFYAIGLEYTCVSKQRAKQALNTLEKHLLTPYGFRTLSPESLEYKAEYKGDEKIRSLAYHQGMVWPFLIGIYTDSLLKTGMSVSEVKKHILKSFQKLFNKHLNMYGLLNISELFRPNPPQVAKGCMLYARSMGEIIRVLSLINK